MTDYRALLVSIVLMLLAFFLPYGIAWFSLGMFVHGLAWGLHIAREKARGVLR